jgi:hypothetical protein
VTEPSDPKISARPRGRGSERTASAEPERQVRVRFLGKGAGRARALKLVARVAEARTDDTVMAQWMVEWNRPRLWRRPEPPTVDDEPPSWLRDSL